MADGEKGGDKGAEPLYAQVPTSEFKKILSDRFADEVRARTWSKLLRAFTFLGLPGLAAVFGLVWKLLDAEVKDKVAAATKGIVSDVNTAMDRDLSRLERRVEDKVGERVAGAFASQHGAAVQTQLRAAMAEQAFQDHMRRTIGDEVSNAWARDKGPLQAKFLEQVMADKAFLDDFGQHVARAMARSDTVPGIIAEALDKSVRGARPEDAGRAGAALALLAAVDQGRANAAVRDLLAEEAGHGRHGMALEGLRHVGFDGLGARAGDAAKMLTAALAVWTAHCTAATCDAEQPAARGLESFLARGRELPEQERAAWVEALSLWHEDTLRGDGRARKPSLHLAPRALGAIGKAEARDVLVRWFKSGRTDLALSAAVALGGQGAASLEDAERLALFKGLWPKDATAEARRALLAEAEWMALGRVSDGRADPAGVHRPEALAVHARLSQAAGRPDVAQWADARRSGLERRRAPAPPAEPCAIGAEEPSRRRAELCALAALIRADKGAGEWGELRRLTYWDEDEMAVLGLLWTVSASRAAEGAPGAEDRLAPLPDLLRTRAAAQVPPAWRLAALLLLRTAPEQAAWRALRELRPTAADAPMFVASSRWLFRPWTVGQAWFVEELKALPPDVGPAVAREIVAAALPPLVAEARSGDPVAAVVGRLSSPGFAALNALHFAHAYDPGAALSAVERENGFRLLAEAAAGGTRGGGEQAGVAGDLLAALLKEAEWSQAVIEMAQDAAPAPRAGPRTPLAPSIRSRFGRLRLAGGDTLALAPAEAGKAAGAPPSVTLHNPATKDTRVLGPGASLRLPGYAEDDWLFRLPEGAAPPAHLRAVPAEPLVPAAAASAPALPAVEEGRVYTVRALPEGPGDGGPLTGWAGTPRLRAGDRVRVSTFDLAEGVDTLVALHRGTDELARDDDGGEGYASRLEWTADKDGAVLIRLSHIGEPGAFRFVLEAVERAPRETAAAFGQPGARADRSR